MMVLFLQFPEMNANKAISMGLLVVNDGIACREKVAEVLRHCTHEVLHTGTVYDALHSIWENKDRLDLVITNVQKLKPEGEAIIRNIGKRLKLKVLLIFTDERAEPKDEPLSFSAYFLTGLSLKALNSLLVNPKGVKEEKMGAAANQQENVETNKASSSNKNVTHLNQKRKAVELHEERSEDSNDDRCKGKKQRVTWTKEMHQKFVDAIARLGYDKAVPKKIVEVMGVPELTRENVASHLQKYRCSMKMESTSGSLPCTSTRAGFREFGVLTSPLSNDLVFDHPRSDTQFFSRIRGPHLSDVRNMMQLRAKHGSSHDNSYNSQFVGYRFIGDQIDYGSINKINKVPDFSTTGRSQDQSTSYVQQQRYMDPNAVQSASYIMQQSPLLGSSSSRIHGQEAELLSSYAPKIESQLQGPPTQQTGECSNSLLDQQQPLDTSANADPSTVLPSDQDFALLPVEAPGDGFSGQTSGGYLDDILQQQCSPAAPPPASPPLVVEDIFEQGGNYDYLFNGIGNTYDQFDIQEFDDTLFSQDD